MYVKHLLSLLCIFVLWPAGLFATELEILWQQSEEKMDLTLKWEGPLNVTTDYQKESNELLLRFDQPIEIPGLNGARKVVEGWTNEIQASYDALFIRPKAGLKVEIKTEANQLHLILHNPNTKAVVTDPNTLSYKLVQARLWRKQGKVKESMALLKSLSENHQKNPSVVVAVASAELALGNWAKALSMANEAIELAPLNEGLWDLKRAILKVKGTQVFAGKKRRWSEGVSNEYITNYGANVRVWQFLFFGALGLYDEFDLSGLRSLTAGSPGAARGGISQTQVYVGFDLPWNLSFKHTQAYQEGVKGGLNELFVYDIFGETTLSQSKNLPYWGVSEGLLGGSYFDQTRIERILRWSPNLEFRGALSSRTYRLLGKNQVQTQAFDGSAKRHWWNPDWLVGRFHHPSLATAELSWTQERQTAAQVELPTVSGGFNQDAYLIKGIVSIDWDESLNSQTYLGYGINRLGQNSPLIGFDIGHRSFSALEVHFFGSRYIDRIITNELGLQANWKF